MWSQPDQIDRVPAVPLHCDPHTKISTFAGSSLHGKHLLAVGAASVETSVLSETYLRTFRNDGDMIAHQKVGAWNALGLPWSSQAKVRGLKWVCNRFRRAIQ